MRFLGVARALQDGLGPAAVARRFDVARSVVERAAEAYGIDLVAADAAEVAEREAAREAKASAMEQARAAREAVRQAARAKRKADAEAAAATRAAAKMERDRRAAEEVAEREERKRKALQRRLDLTLRKIGQAIGVSGDAVRQMIAHTIAETSKDKE